MTFDGSASHLPDTTPRGDEATYPGDEATERRILAYVLWNAAVMTVRTSARPVDLASRLAPYESAASLYEVGFDHVFRGQDDELPGDEVYPRRDVLPVAYARTFLEGRLDEHDLDAVRFSSAGELSGSSRLRLASRSREHPTISIGFGPLAAVHRARLDRYVLDRGLADAGGSKVWCFVGAGEIDEPETRAGLGLAVREGLDNLVVVVDCAMLPPSSQAGDDTTAREELGAELGRRGWNVVTAARGPYGRSDVRSLYAAYRAAAAHTGSPTVVLAQTVSIRASEQGRDPRVASPGVRRAPADQLRALRERIGLIDEIPEDSLGAAAPPYVRPEAGSAARRYVARDGRVLSRPRQAAIAHGRTSIDLPVPEPRVFAELYEGSLGRNVSTTMAFVRLLRNLLRDPGVGRHVVPVVRGKAAGSRLTALASEAGSYVPCSRRPDRAEACQPETDGAHGVGQFIEEGTGEASALASFAAAATARPPLSPPLLPFLVPCSSADLLLLGDAMRAGGDASVRGFVLGTAADRPPGDDALDRGQSLLLASSLPKLRSYDPSFAYEIAAIVESGIAEMHGSHAKDVVYHLTLHDETYPMPALAAGPLGDDVRAGAARGIYRFAPPASPDGPPMDTLHATLLFSGSAWSVAMRAREILAAEWNVSAEAWSVTSYSSLRDDALDVELWNRLHPLGAPRASRVSNVLSRSSGPIVAVTSAVKAVPDLIARFVRQPFVPVAVTTTTKWVTRGSGEADAARVVVTVLAALASTGQISAARVACAIERYETGQYETGPYETVGPERRAGPVDPAVASPSPTLDSGPRTERSTTRGDTSDG